MQRRPCPSTVAGKLSQGGIPYFQTGYSGLTHLRRSIVSAGMLAANPLASCNCGVRRRVFPMESWQLYCDEEALWQWRHIGEDGSVIEESGSRFTFYLDCLTHAKHFGFQAFEMPDV